MPATQGRHILTAAICFLLSTAITAWFILAGKPVYGGHGNMILSGGIAGGKWLLQIMAAIAFLPGCRWLFIRRISFVCMAGSCVLLAFCVAPVQQALGQRGFLLSLVLCVLLMIGLYYRAVRRTQLPLRWFGGWLLCLAIAITLQLTVVF